MNEKIDRLDLRRIIARIDQESADADRRRLPPWMPALGAALFAAGATVGVLGQ